MNRFFTIFIILIFWNNYLLHSESELIQRTVWNNPSPGYLFLAPMDNSLAVYDNSGYKAFSKSFGFLNQGFMDFKMHPNGKLSAYDVLSQKFIVLDSNFNVLDTAGAIGYTTDFHDFLILPNGNYLVIAEADVYIDMRQYVPNGHPNARVNNFILQEINPSTKQVVWQWNAIDHFSVLDATEDIDLQESYIRPFHINSVEMLSDGNLLISCRHMDEIIKINKQTGEIIWRMGGSKSRNNQFTFVNDTIDNFFGFSHQHDPRELPNGNILLFDNGNLRRNPFSRAVEYSIDEANRRVTKVWEYRGHNNIISDAGGSVQRLPNGNTLIGWSGTFSEGGHSYLLSEVTQTGELALEFLSNSGTYRAFRFIFKSDPVTLSVNSAGQYNFVSSTYNTNTTFVVNSISGTGKLTIEKHRYPPYNLNQGGPCSVLPYRWVITKQGINSLGGYLYFNLSGLSGFNDPRELKVYFRSAEGFGSFTELNTTFNSQANRLETSFAGIGEYCLGTAGIGVPVPMSPSNNEINVSLSPKFIWKKFMSGEKYHIQIATDPNFQYLVKDTSNIIDTFYVYTSQLLPGKTYFWRVRAERENCTSSWAETQRFTTIYERISLLLPLDSTLDMPTSVQFTWLASDNAWAYQFQLSIDKNFQKIVIDTTVFNPIVTISNLDFFTEYFWRVRLTRGEQYGIWSEIRKFKTMLSAPLLLFPENGSKNIPTSGTLKWSPVPGAIHYYLVVSTNKQFINNQIEVVDLKDNQFDYTNLEPAKEYFWKVRATGENGKSEWSEVFNFKTQLPKPELIVPPFADTLAPISGLLRWKEVPSATSYELQISEDPNLIFGVQTYKITGLTYYIYSNLVYSTKYYWRVRALNDELESPWSDVSWFRTVPENYLTSPILVYPVNNVLNLKIGDKLRWLPVDKAERYEIQIATDPIFASVVFSEQIADTTYQIGSLAYGTRYYWRVRAINQTSVSFWSEVYSFTTSLRTPTLFAPQDKSIIDLPIEFTWEMTTADAFYNFQIAYDSDFEFVLKQATLYNQNSFILNTAPTETWFYWRVKVVSGKLESDWSETKSFLIPKVNSAEENQKESAVKIFQNNNFRTIQFVGEILKLQIFNLLGNEILEYNIPTNSFLWDVSTQSPGIYFVKIQTPSDLLLKKILLIP